MLLISLAALLRILSNPLANVFQKKLTNKGAHPLILNFYTYLVLSVICLAILPFIHSDNFSFQFWLYSILGGAAGALGNSFLVKALQMGELSVLGPINSYKSIIGILGSIIFLHEFPNAWGLLGIFTIIGGSYFVLGTKTEKISWNIIKNKSIQYRVVAMILTAIEAVFIKKIIIESSVSIAFICWCWFGFAFSFLFLIGIRVNLANEIKSIKFSDWSTYLMLVACIGSMQIATNYVFNHMNVGYALAIFQLSVLLSVIFGFKIFKEKGLYRKLIGATIMLTGSIIIILS